MEWLIRFCAVIFLSVLLQSNATSIEPLEENEGYLLVAFNVESGYVPSHVQLESGGFMGSSLKFDSLKPRDNHWLIPVDAGEYSWDRIFFTKRIYLNLEDSDFKIKVEPGKINYGGHISLYTEMNSNRDQLLGGARVYFNNRASKAMIFLDEQYPALMTRYETVYSGKQRDHFFTHVNSLRNAQ